VPFDKKAKALGDNKVVAETFAALEANLARGNGLKLEELKYRLGRTLKLDPERETFVGDEEANRLLTRPYRAPFVVPEKLA
jgi:hypothetical protein